MVLSAAGAVDPEGHHHVGAERADVADEVAENLLPPPLLEGFFGAEGVAEVDRAREVLFGAIELVRRQQLFRAQDAERVEELRPDLVLAAISPRRGHQRHPHPEMPRVQRQHRVVLIVGMRRRVHQRADGVELP